VSSRIGRSHKVATVCVWSMGLVFALSVLCAVV
jgi:hypothetical protein